jgi:ketosteroid isomerase-like protein
VNAEANLDLATRFHDAMEAGDRDVLGTLLVDTLHPDCEWAPLVIGVEGQTYRGPDGARAFFEDFLDSFEVRYEDRQLRAIGDRAVLFLCRMALRGRASGVDVVQEMGVLYEFDDGLLRRGRAYPSHAEAIAAAEAVATGRETPAEGGARA